MGLKELLGEELYNQVKEKVGDSKIAIVSDGNWIPKDKFDVKINEVKDLQKQIDDRDEELEELKKVDPDELQQTISSLQEKYDTQKEEYEEKLQQQAKDFAIDSYLRDQNAKNLKAVKALIDVEAITYKDGKLIGIDEQVNPLKENEAYLFGASDTGGNDPQIVVGGNPKGGANGPLTKAEIMRESDSTKRQQLIQENMHLFK